MAWVLKMDEVIESGLVHDFDASLSGIGQELGAGAYSMRCARGAGGGRGAALRGARRQLRSFLASFFPPCLFLPSVSFPAPRELARGRGCPLELPGCGPACSSRPENAVFLPLGFALPLFQKTVLGSGSAVVVCSEP